MRYADDTATNELKKVENGERDIITQDMLNLWLGDDNTNAEAWELLLDILNDQYGVEDCVLEVKHHWEENGGDDETE